MAITNADVCTSRKYLDLRTTTTELLSQAITLPTSKPGTPTFSHTVVDGDMPSNVGSLYQYDTMFVVTLDSRTVTANSSTVYGEVYVDGVLQGSQESDVVGSGEYVSAYFSVDAPVGSLVEVYLWQSTADEVVIDEIHYAAAPYHIFLSEKRIYRVDNIIDQTLPDYSRVGGGTPGYLRHGDVMSTYNGSGDIDNEGGNLPLIPDSLYGFQRIYGSSLPYNGISNRTSSRWPSTYNVIGEIYYTVVKE